MKKGGKRLGIYVLFFFIILGKGELQAQRIVVLYAAASPILKALGLSKEVVGVTRSDHLFPHAVRVGSHLRPNLELIKALRPTLLVVGSSKAFPEEYAQRLGVPIFRYDPRTLEEILEAIASLGKRLQREDRAQRLIQRLQRRLQELKPLPRSVTAVYEVSSQPLRLAGQGSIVTDILRVAGAQNLVRSSRKHVLLSPEKVLAWQPEFYLYQVGPMNRRPIPPHQRPYFRGLKSQVVRVPEEEFARPGMNFLGAALKWNRLFYEYLKKKKGSP